MAVPLLLDEVPDVTPYIQYVATNGQTTFPYPFPITQDADLIVIQGGVTLNTDSGYSLTGQGNDTGGNVVFNAGQTVGTVITLYRDIAIERISQFAQNSGFSSATFNAEFNNIYLILQQLEASIMQCLQVPNTNNPAPTTTLTPSRFANSYLSFDSFGNPQPAVLTSSGAITLSILAPILGLNQTAAELAAGITPTNDAVAAGNVNRYGNNVTPGTTDMTAAVQAAVNQSGFGGPRAYAPAGTYGYSTDIAFPLGVQFLQGGSGPWAAGLRGDGPNQTVFKAITGGAGFTNGFYFYSGTDGTYMLADGLRDLQIDCATVASAGVTFAFTNNFSLHNVLIRRSTGRGIYGNNVVMSHLQEVEVTACGSSIFGQIEIDGTLAGGIGGSTTLMLDQVFATNGNASCLGGLLIDRISSVSMLNGSYESTGVPVMISSKASSVVGCSGIVMTGVDMEDPTGEYIQAGYGLTGVYVNGLIVEGCTGAASGATSIPNAVKLSMVNGARFSHNAWAQAGSTTSVYWLEQTNPLRITLQPHPEIFGSGIPYVVSDGSQVGQANPLVEYNSQDSPQRPEMASLAMAVGATAIVNSVAGGQGGYYQRIVLANTGSKNIATMTGNCLIDGTIVYIRGDGESTLTYGTSGNAFRSTSGSGVATVAGVWTSWIYSSSIAAWCQIGG